MKIRALLPALLFSILLAAAASGRPATIVLEPAGGVHEERTGWARINCLPSGGAVITVHVEGLDSGTYNVAFLGDARGTAIAGVVRAGGNGRGTARLQAARCPLGKFETLAVLDAGKVLLVGTLPASEPGE